MYLTMDGYICDDHQPLVQLFKTPEIFSYGLNNAFGDLLLDN